MEIIFQNMDEFIENIGFVMNFWNDDIKFHM